MKTAHDVKLLNGSKQEVSYTGVETVTMPGTDGQDKVFTAGAPIDAMDISPDFSGGDMPLEAPEGYVVRSATIKKPEGAEQVIAKGQTLAGIVGAYVTPGTAKEITPDFSEGDQTVTAEGDERWSEVTVKKPEGLVPENILNGVDVAGVIGTNGAVKNLVQVIDFDGTILAQNDLCEGSTFTLPNAPTHNGLVFDGWSSPVKIVDNAVVVGDRDITIGPMYHTESGATEIDIILTKATGMYFKFLSSRLTGMTSIDWGDGSTDSTLTHTYSSYGEYTIKIYGMTAIAAGTSSGGIVNANNYMVTAIRISADVVGIGDYSFFRCNGVKSVTVSSNLTSIGAYAFEYCYNLKGFVLPCGITGISNYCFVYCYALSSVAVPEGIKSIGLSAFNGCRLLTSITIPNGVTSIGNSAFTNCSLKSITIPGSIETIGSESFISCYTLSRIKILPGVTALASSMFSNCGEIVDITLPSSVVKIGGYCFSECHKLKSVVCEATELSIDSSAFYECHALERFVMPNEGTVLNIGISAFNNCYNLSIFPVIKAVSVGNMAFYNCQSLETVVMHEGVTSIGTNAFSYSFGLKQIKIPSSITSIGNSAFSQLYRITEYDFSAFSSVPTLGKTAFRSCNGALKILVPASLYDTWVAATNWSTYANYIYPV